MFGCQTLGSLGTIIIASVPGPGVRRSYNLARPRILLASAGLGTYLHRKFYSPTGFHLQVVWGWGYDPISVLRHGGCKSQDVRRVTSYASSNYSSLSRNANGAHTFLEVGSS